MILKVKKLPSVPLPDYKSFGAAGLDLASTEDGLIHPGETRAFGTGIAVEIPWGFEGQVRGRSGLAFKYGVLGYVGTIDSDYRGELKVLLFNSSHYPYRVVRGDRIGQLIIAAVQQPEIIEVQELNETARGTAGFGSTGV